MFLLENNCRIVSISLQHYFSDYLIDLTTLRSINANIDVTKVRIREKTKATLMTLFSSPNLSIDAAAF